MGHTWKDRPKALRRGTPARRVPPSRRLEDKETSPGGITRQPYGRRLVQSNAYRFEVDVREAAEGVHAPMFDTLVQQSRDVPRRFLFQDEKEWTTSSPSPSSSSSSLRQLFHLNDGSELAARLYTLPVHERLGIELDVLTQDVRRVGRLETGPPPKQKPLEPSHTSPQNDDAVLGELLALTSRSTGDDDGDPAPPPPRTSPDLPTGIEASEEDLEKWLDAFV